MNKQDIQKLKEAYQGITEQLKHFAFEVADSTDEMKEYAEKEAVLIDQQEEIVLRAGSIHPTTKQEAAGLLELWELDQSCGEFHAEISHKLISRVQEYLTLG